MKWFLIVIGTFAMVCDSTLVVTPSNAAVANGTKVTLACRTDSRVSRLIWMTEVNKAVQTIYTGNTIPRAFSKSYEIEARIEGEFNLKIEATEATARRYICEEPGVEQASAELIVMASVPMCSVISIFASHQYFRVEIQCLLQSKGNWLPSVKWRLSGKTEHVDEKGSISTEALEEYSPENRSLTSTLFITGTRRIQGLSYHVMLGFEASKRPTHTSATNVPEYSYEWVSAPVSIDPGEDTTIKISLVAGFVVFLIVLTAIIVHLIRKIRVLKLNSTNDMRLNNEGTTAMVRIQPPNVQGGVPVFEDVLEMNSNLVQDYDILNESRIQRSEYLELIPDISSEYIDTRVAIRKTPLERHQSKLPDNSIGSAAVVRGSDLDYFVPIVNKDNY